MVASLEQHLVYYVLTLTTIIIILSGPLLRFLHRKGLSDLSLGISKFFRELAPSFLISWAPSYRQLLQ